METVLVIRMLDANREHPYRISDWIGASLLLERVMIGRTMVIGFIGPVQYG